MVSMGFAGCTGGLGRGKDLSNGLSSGGGHGGKGGLGCYNDSCAEGGNVYGNPDLPCELGSGSGNDSFATSTAGGGIIGKLMLQAEDSKHLFQLCYCIDFHICSKCVPV